MRRVLGRRGFAAGPAERVWRGLRSKNGSTIRALRSDPLEFHTDYRWNWPFLSNRYRDFTSHKPQDLGNAARGQSRMDSKRVSAEGSSIGSQSRCSLFRGDLNKPVTLGSSSLDPAIFYDEHDVLRTGPNQSDMFPTPLGSDSGRAISSTSVSVPWSGSTSLSSLLVMNAKSGAAAVPRTDDCHANAVC